MRRNRIVFSLGLGAVVFAIGGLALASSAFAASPPAPSSPVGNTTLSLVADQLTSWQYPYDRTIHRIVVATNTGTSFGEWTMQQPSIAGYPDGSPICMPQPGYLYLAAGESETIECSIEFPASLPESQTWQQGETHSVPLVLGFTPINASNGSSSTAPISITLDNVVSVVLPPPQQSTPNSLLPDPNATIRGVVTDAVTRRPIVNQVDIAVRNQEAGWIYHATPTSSGSFLVPVVAHERPYFNDWQPYLVTVTAPGYASQTALVRPETQSTTTLAFRLRRPSAVGRYRLVTTINTGAPTARMSLSASGRYAAIAPYADTAFPPGYVQAHAQLTFIDLATAHELWSYPLQGLVLGVAVSPNGQDVAAPYPGPDASVDPTGAPNLIEVNHFGHLVWNRPVYGDPALATASIDGQTIQVNPSGAHAVSYSPDSRWLAVGTPTGQLEVIDAATQSVRWTAFLRDQVRALAWNPGGTRVFASSGDSDLYCLDALTGQVIWKTYVAGWSLAFAASPHYILVSAKEGDSIKLVNASSGSIVWSYPTSETSMGLAISPNESEFASVNSSGSSETTVVFNRAGRVLWTSPDAANAVAFSADGKYLLTESPNFTGPATDTVHLYNALTGEQVWSAVLPPASTTPVWNHGEDGVLYASRGAATILVGSAENGQVYIYRGGVTATVHH